MTTKKVISIIALLVGSVGFPLYASMISVQPAYSDVRFQPVDIFHAECVQDAQVLMSLKEKNVSQIHLVLNYTPEDVEILRVMGAGQTSADYQMGSDSVIFDTYNPVLTDQSVLLTLSLQSKPGVTSTTLVAMPDSYYVVKGKKILFNESIAIAFQSVPECDPDIIPPSVHLMFPENIDTPLTLDQYFVFEVNDNGKGIDKNSIKIFLNDQAYTADSENLKRKGNYITFYPQDWLPINKKINLQVVVDDLQSYGGANETEKTFSFKTSTGMTLLDNITPMLFRQISREGAKLAGSTEECALLQNFYTRSDLSFQAGLMPILEKLSCDLSALNTDDASVTTHDAAPTKNNGLTYVSVFAALGRVLFIIVFGLKLHYLVSYKKHKKLADKYRNG